MNVALDFDDRQSKRILREMRKAGGFTSDAEMIRAALRILRTLQEQAKEGYTEVIVQNPFTGDQQLLMGIEDVLGLRHGKEKDES